MDSYKNNWLPYLKNSIPISAFGFATCMYLVSLEGWRRGLELTFQIKSRKNLFYGVKYTLANGSNVHLFNGSRGDASSNKAISICSNKGLTNKYLSKNNVPVPEGKSFASGTNDKDIISYANELGYPLVLKPVAGGGGAGVITNIQNEHDMKISLNKIRNRLMRKEVIVEKYFVGDDFRVNVLDGEVIGAFHRRTQSVVGDGNLSLKELLYNKNTERAQSPFLANKVIKMDKKMKDLLMEKNISPTYVPEVNERVFLRRSGEYFGERDAIEATNKLTSEMKGIALSAVKSIPNLKYAGVDMLINTKKNIGIVNEVNSKPQISNHVFPMEGNAIDIPRKIIDYYFPETKYVGNINPNYFYNFDPVLENFNNATASSIKIISLKEKE